MEVKKIKSKFIFSALLVMALVIMSVTTVSALITFEVPSPSSGDVLGNDTNINVSISGGLEGGAGVTLNCSAYVSSASTANSTEYLRTIADGVLNETYNNVSMYINISYLHFEDASDYVVKVACYNDTANENGTLTGLIVDYSIPTVASSISPTGIVNNNTLSFFATVVGTQTTSCTLIADSPIGSVSSQAMTHTGDTCTASIASVPAQTYNYLIRVSDGLNTTDSSTQTVTIDTPSSTRSVGDTTKVISDVEGGGIPTPVKLWLIGIVILIAIVVFIRKK